MGRVREAELINGQVDSSKSPELSPRLDGFLEEAKE
jgi:hypothetical protein